MTLTWSDVLHALYTHQWESLVSFNISTFGKDTSSCFVLFLSAQYLVKLLQFMYPIVYNLWHICLIVLVQKAIYLFYIYMTEYMDRWLNRPTKPKPRDQSGQGVPGAEFEVTVNIYFLKVNQATTKQCRKTARKRKTTTRRQEWPQIVTKKQLVANWQRSVAKCQQNVAKWRIATWNDYKNGFSLGVLLLLVGWRA